MLNKNLYVRVKRSRDEEPAESLCIVEDSAPAKKRSIKTLEAQLSNLSAISAPVSEPKRLHLSRVRTLSCADDNMLTETSMQERGHVEPPRKKRVAARIVVTSGSKTVIPESESQQPYIVIDMAQMARKSSTVTSVTSAVSTTTATTTATSSPARITARILDPASRLLDRGITTAMKSGDFNDISSALMQGANPDHQNINGFTALMIAAQHCNIRMVKRLLMKSVDVTKENHNHQTALDLINTNIRNKADSIEIQNLIQNAVLKSQQTAQRQAAILRENIRQTALMSNKDETMKDGEEGEYVYDIYCVNTDNTDTIMETVENTTTTTPTTTTTKQDTTTTTTTTPTSTSLTTDPLYSIVRVEGLRILDSEHIELHMAYDSDWSDLGDDEEPDSNDERFHGNDYPEDEENEGQELRDDSSVEEQPKRRAVARRGGGNKLNTTATTSRSTSILPTTVLRNTTSTSTTGRKVAFAGDTEDGEVNFDELLQQEEAEEDSEEHSGEDSWKGEEDSDMEEEAALYRQLDGDYTEYYDSNTVGDTIQREGENSDYDLEADEETERRLYHTQQQQQNRAAASSSSGTSSTMSHKKKASSHGKKSTNPSANTTTNTATTTTSTIKPSHKLSSYKDLLYDDDVNLPQFDRKFGIGKVLRPQLLRGPYSHTTTTSNGSTTATVSEFASSGLYQEVHTTESLQELWDEPPIEHTSTTTATTTSNSMCTINNTSNNSSNDVSKEHSDRLHDMRSRTGMTFASSIREFDIHTGLAKYGVELSDDEQDHIDSVSEQYTLYPSVVDSNMSNNMKQSSYNTTNTTTGTSNTTITTSSTTTQLKYETIKPSLNTIAYDSELDNSD